MLSRVWTFPEMFVDVYVSKYFYFWYIYIYMYNQWLPSSKDSTFMILKKQRQQKTDTKGLTVRHCNFFSCSNSPRLPVNYDTTSKNTVAHSTFEHLEHHNISKIVILPHKSHVSHKYKCMNDGFLINQHADQKKFRPRRTQFYVENDFFKNSRFATAK